MIAFNLAAHNEKETDLCICASCNTSLQLKKQHEFCQTLEDSAFCEAIKHTGPGAAAGYAEILFRFITDGCRLDAFFQEEAADE